MKNRIFGTLGSEYFIKSIKENEKRIEELDETLSETHARLSGLYKGAISGLIQDLQVHEKKTIIIKDCETCNGKGIVDLLSCNKYASDCCGGCTKEYDCYDCEGLGKVEEEEEGPHKERYR